MNTTAEKTPLNEAIHTCRCVADNASYQLIGIADSLYRLGMTSLATELEGIAERIVIGPREVSGAYGADLTNQVHHAEVMMGNLLKATLAGCITAPKAKAEASL